MNRNFKIGMDAGEQGFLSGSKDRASSAPPNADMSDDMKNYHSRDKHYTNKSVYDVQGPHLERRHYTRDDLNREKSFALK